jgi:hypothetical protein
MPPPNLIATTRASLQVSLLSPITRLYHFAPVTSPRFLGRLQRQARVRIDAKLLGETAYREGLEQLPQKSRGSHRHATEIPQER